MEIDIDALPMGPEEMSPAGIETVVLAHPVLPRGRMVDVVDVDRSLGGREERIVGRLDEDGVETEVTIKQEPED